MRYASNLHGIIFKDKVNGQEFGSLFFVRFFPSLIQLVVRLLLHSNFSLVFSFSFSFFVLSSIFVGIDERIFRHTEITEASRRMEKHDGSAAIDVCGCWRFGGRWVRLAKEYR